MAVYRCSSRSFDMSHNNFLPFILHHLEGGAIGMASASLAAHFGMRAAERLPGESPMPQCLYCLRPLEWHEAFPLFGWLMRDKPKTFPCPCGKRTGLWQQPAIEIAGFILGFLAIALGQWPSGIIVLCAGLGVLAAIAAIDIIFGIIPDMLNVALMVLGLLWLVMSGGDIFMGLVNSAGLLALGLFLALGYSKWRGKEMLGLGDVKFFAAAGLWLPTLMAPWFLSLAGFIGALFGIWWQKTGGGKESPFAPALCASLVCCLYYLLLWPL
jgi:prepilin signal peptidase PulO-like enzyme (type II secretory pathway)